MKERAFLKVGIFGGTFNPPHIGHERSAKLAARLLELDLLVIIPAGIPPHKTLPAGTPPADMRLHMTRCAFENEPSTTISDIEIRKPGQSYTIETVSAVKESYPDAELFLLVGTDMYLSLETWFNSEILLNSVTPAVFSRGTDDLEQIGSYSQVIAEKYGTSTRTVMNEVVDISSSQIRGMLPQRKGAGYIKDTIYSYIIKNRLYNAKPDWDWLRVRAYSMLDEKRIPHVRGCEESAVQLAQHWGVDADDAREAAILHDITKRLSTDENLEVLEKHGVAVSKLEHHGEKLLHSKTGAVMARSEFGVSDEVYDAIMWHTTGRAGMSMLEKVIYLADYIEPTRELDGIEDLRAVAYQSLDKAVKMGLQMSIADMTERGITPNKTTFDALDDLN